MIVCGHFKISVIRTKFLLACFLTERLGGDSWEMKFGDTSLKHEEGPFRNNLSTVWGCLKELVERVIDKAIYNVSQNAKSLKSSRFKIFA